MRKHFSRLVQKSVIRYAPPIQNKESKQGEFRGHNPKIMTSRMVIYKKAYNTAVPEEEQKEQDRSVFEFCRKLFKIYSRCCFWKQSMDT